MLCVPLTDFIHGPINAREGHPVEIPDGTAADLERAGLVRVSVNKATKVAAGKPKDDGAGQPSSVSPPAPLLQTETFPVSRRGVKKSLKKGR